MRRSQATASLTAAVFFVLSGTAIGAGWGTHGQPSYDMVSSHTWIYDGLARLAADGVLGDLDPQDVLLSRTYTRMEIAQMLIDLADEEELSPRQELVALQLADEVREELDFLGEEPEELFPDAADYIDTAIAWAAGQWERERGEDRAIAAGSASYLGLRGRGISFGATVTNDRRLESDEWRQFDLLDRAHYRSRGRDWTWELAKGYDWLGTAGTGSLYLGDSSPSMYLARAGKTFSLGSLGRWRFETQAAGFREEGETFYLLSKSVRKTISNSWTFALYDLVKTTKTPNPLMLVAPLQVYQAAILNDVDRKWNGMMGVEAVFHPNTKFEAYGQWMVDDISNPFDHNPNTPKKTGVLVGVRGRPGSLLSGGPRYQIEYASIDSRAYEATRSDVPLLSWTHDGLPLAWPFGPDQRTLSVRGEMPLSKSVDLTLGLLNIDSKSSDNREMVIYAEPSWQVCKHSNLSLGVERHSGGDDYWVTTLQLMAWY